MIIKENCFAYKDGKCTALNELHCENCNFYRTDLKRSDIERSIKTYTKTYGNN